LLLLLYVIILRILNRLTFIRHNNDDIDQTLTLITNLYLSMTYTIKYLLTFYFNIY